MGTGEKKSVDTRSLSHSCFPSALGIGPLLSRSSPLLLPLFALAQNDLFPPPITQPGTKWVLSP